MGQNGTSTTADYSENPERERLEANGDAWKKWGPYLSERQWGTVREDYSPDGAAWEYFPHDHARSRVYRWGEDGIGGFSDDKCRLCLAVAMWNGVDPILKERLYGLTNTEGNHGEDVKEVYFYLDATPTHSYLKMLYKYPQAAFPYERLGRENARRGKEEREYDLIDTGIFDDDRYFDVFIEYARADVDDILMRITAINRGPEPAELHLLPHVWFRNTWLWGRRPQMPGLRLERPGVLYLDHHRLGRLLVEVEGSPEILVTDNLSNSERLGGQPNDGYVKDAFHEHVVGGKRDVVNPAQQGTKACALYRDIVDPGKELIVRLRLRPRASVEAHPDWEDFERVFAQRIIEADKFYDVLQKEIADPDARLVQRQALAGMIWNKQFFYYDVNQWLMGDPTQPRPPESRRRGRNPSWGHLNNADVLSMPDKWEYPWYAAWDLAFHCLPLALIDVDFAKHQLDLLTREWYMHPNGQLPAYEWSFSDVNPPVHAWATWRVYQIDRKARGRPDLKFLERVFHKLLLNFTWWVNQKDHDGNNVFQGGFLGLDNIGVFDRSRELPTGGHLDQSDGTAWMAMYSLNLLRIALELAQHNDSYEDIASKFFEHFLQIAEAMAGKGGAGLWHEEDEFYYDWLHLEHADGQETKLPMRLRSMVGLIPLYAVEVLEPELLEKLPSFKRRLDWFLEHRHDLADLISHWEKPGKGQRMLLSLLRGHRMKCLIRRMVESSEFLSSFGVRSLSKHHEDHPFAFECDKQTHTVAYTPAESSSDLFGGNSNWRGPVWFPVNYLLIESLQRFHHYYGDDFKIECPTSSGNMMTLLEIADELSRRLVRLFLRDEHGMRPAMANHPKLQEDPYFRDCILFYEYFHGDNGRGLGASHQTGWTGLVAKLIQPRTRPR